MVCMHDKGYSLLFKIHVFNEELYKFLPHGDLEFSLDEGLKSPAEIKHQKTSQLISCITDEISKYLDMEESRIRKLV